MALLLVLGGGNWTMPLPRLLAELVGVAVLAGAVAAGGRRADLHLTLIDRLVLALLGLFALHLLPLPPALWTALPGRDLAAQADRAVLGAPVWRPLTLDAEATLRAFAMLVPALAVYLAVRLGDAARRQALLRGVVMGLGLAAALALAQISAPGAAWLMPYPRGDYAWPIGFFTNRNHHAAFACMALPLVAAWIGPRLPPGPARAGLLAGLTLMVAAMVLVTASRAGAALLPLAVAATWLAAMDGAPGRRRQGLLLAVLAGGALAAGAAVFALGGDAVLSVLRRDSPLSDQRLDYWPLVADAAMSFWPAGSGIGTFRAAYEMHEPLESLGPLYLNQAHNDYLQILLEAGVPGLVLALVAVWELCLAAARAWMAGDRVARLAAVAMPLPLLHALVDYPLRTVALSSLFALAVALLAQQDGRGQTTAAG